jgi:hypothetical protein
METGDSAQNQPMMLLMRKKQLESYGVSGQGSENGMF